MIESLANNLSVIILLSAPCGRENLYYTCPRFKIFINFIFVLPVSVRYYTGLGLVLT